MPPAAQNTIASPISFEGKGIHSGASCNLKICPAGPGTGIRFIRRDLPASPEIPARMDCVSPQRTTRQTVLRAKSDPSASVQTVEHFLATLHALKVDNARIEMTGPEPPIFDGSAQAITAEVLRTGIQPLENSSAPFFRIERPVSLAIPTSEVSYSAWPSEELKITYFLDYAKHPFIGAQTASFTITPEIYAKEIAPARTFALYEEIEPLIAAGLIKGGEIDNAIVIGRQGPLNTKLLWENELARHKLLDFLGDLFLLGSRVLGHLVSHKGGHAANHLFLQHLRKEFCAHA